MPLATLCGPPRAASATLRQPWNMTASVREHLVTFAHGHPPFQMLLRPSNYDGPESWSRLIREQEYVYHIAMLRMIIAHVVRKGEECVAVDVGANSGYISLAAASLGCKVRAFEANPSTAKNARHSFALNGHLMPRLTMQNVAVGRTSGVLWFAVRRGGGSIYDRVVSDEDIARGLEPGFHAVRVHAAPLHSLMGVPRPEVVHFMKLDCEGCEAQAIETMAPMLERGAVKIILSEWITSRVLQVSGNASLAAALAVLRRGRYRSYSWEGTQQKLSVLRDPRTEVGDLFLVHESVSSFSKWMRNPSGGMLAAWAALQKCDEGPEQPRRDGGVTQFEDARGGVHAERGTRKTKPKRRAVGSV